MRRIKNGIKPPSFTHSWIVAVFKKLKQTLLVKAIVLSTSLFAASVEVEKGVFLHYVEQGTGDPILFVPGWTFPGQVFQSQMDFFKKGHRVILLDPRSTGKSTQTKSGHSYKQYGQDLHRFIKKLKLNRVVLVGWSYGCLQTFEYVKQQGTGKLKAFICIDQSPKPLGSNETWSEGPKSAFVEFSKELRARRKAFTGEYIDSYFLTDKHAIDEKHRAWLIEQSLITSTEIALELMKSGEKADYTHVVSELPSKIPTLFIVSKIYGDKAKKWWSEKTNKCELESFGSHYMFHEFADKFNSTVAKFLKNSSK